MRLQLASSILATIRHAATTSSALASGITTTSTIQQAAYTAKTPPRILVTGAGGQIGSELVPFLRNKLGDSNVIASDLRPLAAQGSSGLFVPCDVVNKQQLESIVKDHHITGIVHLATLLSAVGERNPSLALQVNTTGIQNVLELAVQHGLQVYAPSTIAVFGADTPRHNTPDSTIMHPSTMYGITKVHQELLGQYYAQRYGVDYRSLRYPGIISALSLPGGGTTDYAVDIFHHALREGSYTCFLPPDAELPMMYMPDCLEATWKLMTSPREALTRSTYNITAMSFTPAQLAAAIQRRLPHFRIRYEPDFRAAIARTWPASIDDSLARRDWGWRPRFDLEAMADNMLFTLSEVLRPPALTATQEQASAAAAASAAAVDIAVCEPAVAEVAA